MYRPSRPALWDRLSTILAWWLIFTDCTVHAVSPWIMAWSDDKFGPDGPWQAVSVGVGTPAQTIALYPGGRWSSGILLTTICDNQTTSSTCYAKKAGLFDQTESSTGGNVTQPTSWASYSSASVDGEVWKNTFYDQVTLAGATTIPNVSMVGIHYAYQTYPNGRSYPIEVGTLSLGAPALNHVWEVYMTFITSYMWTTASRRIPSYSYGLHIGSVALGIPGSLLLGGYDQNRIMGAVSSQSFSPYGKRAGGNLVIGLQRIEIGVATGGSPWNYTKKGNLLTESNSSMIAPVSVELDPLRPYLYLPQSTCDAITSQLPVTFDNGLGLYFWNKSSSHYRSIVSSPAYLSFMFQKDSTNNQNITIKVPFSLLNLTLEAPLVDSDTSYFPCFPTNESYTLGRAFLQAAFIGENYASGDGNGAWFLAQAPGPGVIDTPTQVNIEVDDRTIAGTDDSWEVSWEAHWTPLALANTTASDSKLSQSSTGLSEGAKIGIGVGIGCASAIVICALVWFFIRRRRKAAAENQPHVSQMTLHSYSTPLTERQELADKDTSSRIHEAPNDVSHIRNGTYELD
ncbi:hypothetical protein N7495_000742 [Penicillium taxi]|uniref:uncharacterized protein n=1 Tax=Penicillium taxi TaxID=168475 RepID=UPI0025459DD9|nr:uncharacterized protein N7495_000742 [Penicillium taxi]KAJ5908060.1 hypothetical protein N7495_000742 [Penicillium taxi]